MPGRRGAFRHLVLLVFTPVVGLLTLLAPSAIAAGSVPGAAASVMSTSITPDRAQAARYLTASVNKKKVRKGKRVRVYGTIVAPDAPECAAHVVLTLERSTKGAPYKVVRAVTTDAQGRYSVRTKVRKKSRFRLSAPATDACVELQSPPRSVGIRKGKK